MPRPPRDPEETRRLQGFAALLAVQCFFGLFPVFIKLAEDGGAGFTPRAMAGWRMTCAAFVLGGLAFVRDGRRGIPRPADLARLFVCSIFGIVLNQVLALEGIVRSSVVDAGLLMTLIPVFTYAMAVLVRQEVLRSRRALGILVALGGVLVLTLAARGDPALGDERLLGDALIVVNCASYALYLVMARPLLARYSALTVIGWIFTFSLLSLPVVLAGQPLLPRGGSASVWWSLGYILVFPTILAYLLNTYALARVSASTTAVFIYLQPLVAALGGWSILGERPSLLSGLAALLLFAGIWLVTTTPARPRRLVREA